MGIRPLEKIRVLDLTQEICRPFCTQMLADLGATVIKIEPPEGDSSRRRGIRHGGSSTSYMSLNRGKKSMLLDLGREEERTLFLQLAGSADIIVEDLGPGVCDRLGIGYTDVRKRKPDILYLSLTGYGHQGMFRDYSSQDAIVQALSGFMSITGELGGAYTKAGAPLADIFTGIYGTIGVLAGIIHRRHTGKSLYIDIAKLDVMLSAMPDTFAKYMNTGQTTRPKGCRHQLAGFFGPAKTKDGAVICMAAQDHQFKAMAEILGLEGLEKEERFNSMNKRCVHIAELEPIIFSKTMELTMDELTEKLLKRKIPAGSIYTIDKILESGYARYHRSLMEVTDKAEGTFKVVGPPLRSSQFQWAEDAAVSQLGEYTEAIVRELCGTAGAWTGRTADGGLAEGTPAEGRTAAKVPAERLSVKEPVTDRPLAGIRILDLTRFMAGPLGTRILADLGAEVIKVERSDKLSEFSRTTEPTFGTTSAYFLSINSGKEDIQLDLDRPDHREVFLRLAEHCDVVTDNFRPGITEKLHIAYEDVKKRNPDVIYSTVSGFGYTGPYRTQGCVDTVAQAMSGLMSLTGRREGEPVRCGSSVADVCASLYGAVAVLASIIYREQTGQGGFVDAPMISSMLSVLAEEAAAYLDQGVVARGDGNRDRSRALFQTVPASDGAVMVEAATEEHFAAFVRLLGRPSLLEDRWYGDPRSRLEHIGTLEEALFPVTRTMTMTELAGACRRAGIPAGEVNTLERIFRSGYIEERRLIRRVHDSKEGTFKVLNLPIRFDRFAIPEESFAPQPGEHGAKIVKRILGLSEDEIVRVWPIAGQKG
ncbi:MAG: CoA transferase [Lachnospiraceae bacterium]|nr:CoA transferase [Lachnospiraceae bacterium]